jgi:hypothetical protein
MYSLCIYSHKTGIMLFVNQREYIHLESPILIGTVVVVVDIATRLQHFRAASLLLQKMLANDRMGGGANEMFRIAIAIAARSRQCYGSIVLRRCASRGHCSRWWSSSFPRSSSSSSSCRPKERRSPIVTLVQRGQHMTMTAARCQSTRAGCRCRGPSANDNLRQSTPSFRRPLGSIGGAICAS